MPTKPDGPSDRPERSETDTSLREERGKTDEELAKRSSSIESEADRVVELARARANELLTAARRKADVALAREGDAGPAAAHSISEERSTEDRALAEERGEADQKLSEERASRDAALAGLLALEREATDERLLVERARADHAIASRDDFLGMVSHDLRTMLGGIAMSASLLLSLPPEGDVGQKAHREAQRIRRFTARMTRLVGDLLDVVSIESGSLSVVPQRHDAARLLSDTMEAFQPVASASGVTMTADVAAGSVLARFDHERVVQVLSNLVSNALKFTKPGGRVELRVAPREGSVEFTVRDDGCGIAADQLDAIFERFWQAGRADRRGLGLGLYIARCIVEAHGGTIWAESEPGRGSTFHFTLPGWRESPNPPLSIDAPSRTKPASA